MGFTKVAPMLAELSNIEIPHEFAALENLRMFSFYGNNFSEVPAFLQDIPSSGYDTLGWGDE